jgi:6-pyruvoyl-tetrahydropterin synthase
MDDFVSVGVKHEIQMGHRIWNLPGKCTHLHGHTWTITLQVTGYQPEGSPILIDFGEIKKKWRPWLDQTYDHHFCFDRHDPLFKEYEGSVDPGHWARLYPGYVLIDKPPSCENLANYFVREAKDMLWFPQARTWSVTVAEGNVNYAIAEIE